MKWDPVKRRYVDDNGRVMRSVEVRKHIDEYIAAEQKQVDRQSKKLFAGAITLAAFFEFMRHKITNWHGLAGTIAYGGEDLMGDTQNERINLKILSELAYLNEFETDAEASFAAAERLASEAVSSIEIPAGLESVAQERITEALLQAAPSEAEQVIKQATIEALADSLGAEEAAAVAETLTVGATEELIGGTIESRAGMYAESLFATFENSVRDRETDAGAVGVRRVSEDDSHSCEECPALANDEFVPFDEITDIGDTICMSNCRCSFEFSYEGVEPLTVDRRLTG